MKVTQHNNEIVMITNAGEVQYIFVPRMDHLSPQAFQKGNIISHDLPLTIVDLGDKNESAT